MALVTCGECGREISDKAAARVGCGAPVAASDLRGRFENRKIGISAEAGLFKLWMWTEQSRGRMAKIAKKTKRYPSDLTDEEWNRSLR